LSYSPLPKVYHIIEPLSTPRPIGAILHGVVALSDEVPEAG